MWDPAVRESLGDPSPTGGIRAQISWNGEPPGAIALDLAAVNKRGKNEQEGASGRHVFKAESPVFITEGRGWGQRE